MKALLVLLSVLLVSCGESPILNHEMEKNFNVNLLNTADAEYSLGKLGYGLKVDWIEGPKMGESRFTLKTWKKSTGTSQGPFQDVPELAIILWMPAMGHGSAPVKITKTNSGEYDVSSVFFIMAGKWEVKFQAKNNGQVVDETILSLTL